MKHMTSAQIDEINELLKNHGEALTAFYDAGIHYGLKLSEKWIFTGVIIGIALGAAIDGIKYIKSKCKTKKES